MEIDDILNNKQNKKKNSGNKGKRCELEIVKILNNRFQNILSENPDWGSFSRSSGSGNRWGQVLHLPKHARDTYGGDITCPENFKFVIESKGGYNDIDLNLVFENGHKSIDEFMKQSEDDSKRTKRKPLLIWKKDRKPKLAFLKTKDLPENTQWEYSLTYRDWSCLSLRDFLTLCEDSYFFNI